MELLIKIAWRNVWRNRNRSLVVVGAIAIGIWATLFLIGFARGMNTQRTSEAIENELGHFQIHHPRFLAEDRNIKYALPDGLSLASELSKNKSVLNVATRLVVPALMASPYTSTEVQVNGIIPQEEAVGTYLNDKLQEGTYFNSVKRNPIIVSQKLAEKLSLKLKSKIVLTFQDTSNNIVASAFRVEALYKTNNSLFDERQVFVRRGDLQKIAGHPLVNEIAVKLKDQQDLNQFVTIFKKNHPKVLTETWSEIAPDLELFNTAFDQGMQIFVTIILLALAFGIVNTMLMAVLERTKEIGILMSVGMNKKRLFLMILLETVFLSITGTPLGLLFGWGTITYFGSKGIDLTIVGQGLESLGYSSMVYPQITPDFYFDTVMKVIVIAILAALYPASRALKLNPLEAIRKI